MAMAKVGIAGRWIIAMAVVIVMAIITVVVALCSCIHTVVHLNSGAVAAVVFYVKIDHVPRENFILRTDSKVSFMSCWSKRPQVHILFLSNSLVKSANVFFSLNSPFIISYIILPIWSERDSLNIVTCRWSSRLNRKTWKRPPLSNYVGRKTTARVVTISATANKHDQYHRFLAAHQSQCSWYHHLLACEKNTRTAYQI